MESTSSNYVRQDSVDSVIKHFNFAARSQVKLLEEKNLDLQKQVEHSNEALIIAVSERDQAYQACTQLGKKCKKLTSTVAVHETEIGYLKKELKHLQADKENRKHIETRRMKEMQSIKGKASRRHTVSSSASSDGISNTTLDSLFETSLSPLSPTEPAGMRKRVLSFSSGLNDASSSSEVQRLRVENSHYLAKVRQLEEKISYLRQDMHAKDPEFTDVSFGSDTGKDVQTSVVQTCLEEAIDGNLQLREENASLLLQLQSLQSAVESQKADKSLQVSNDDISTDVPPSVPEQTSVDGVHVSPGKPAQPVTGFETDLDQQKKPELTKGASELQDSVTKSKDVQDICDLLALCVSIGKEKPAAPRVLDTEVSTYTSTVGQGVLSPLEELDELS